MLESVALEEDAWGGVAGAEEVWAIAAGMPREATNKIAERDVVVHDMTFIVLFSPFACITFRQTALLYALSNSTQLAKLRMLAGITIKPLKIRDLILLQ